MGWGGEEAILFHFERMDFIFGLCIHYGVVMSVLVILPTNAKLSW